MTQNDDRQELSQFFYMQAKNMNTLEKKTKAFQIFKMEIVTGFIPESN